MKRELLDVWRFRNVHERTMTTLTTDADREISIEPPVKLEAGRIYAVCLYSDDTVEVSEVQP